MIIDCPRCTAHAMHPVYHDPTILAKCSACSHEVLEFSEVAVRANNRRLDALLAARPKKAR